MEKSIRLLVIVLLWGGVGAIVVCGVVYNDEIEGFQRAMYEAIPWRAAIGSSIVFGGLGAVATSWIWTVKAEDLKIRILEKAREIEREKVAIPASDNRRLQETAVELHTQRLRVEIEHLRTRAFAAFLPGVLLCISAICGPVVSYMLAKDHPEHWQYVFGGSTVALVLLALLIPNLGLGRTSPPTALRREIA